LDLIEDRPFLEAAEEAVGLEVRGGGLDGVVEADVSGVRPKGSGEGCLAGLSGAGQENGGEEVEGKEEGCLEAANQHVADYQLLNVFLSIIDLSRFVAVPAQKRSSIQPPVAKTSTIKPPLIAYCSFRTDER
jgi:hypothetical protein